MYFYWLYPNEWYIGLRRAYDPADEGYYWTFGFIFFEIGKEYIP